MTGTAASPKSPQDLERARFNMIEQQIRPWDVLDQRVLDVIATTPREAFVPERYQTTLAFSDFSIPLEHGQYMMPPKLEGRLLQALGLRPTDRVLEIATGSAYLTACLARLAAQVVSVDIFADFKYAAERKLAGQGIANVDLKVEDAAAGWNGQEFDAIAVTGSAAGAARRLPPQPGHRRPVVRHRRQATHHGGAADHPRRAGSVGDRKPVRHRRAAADQRAGAGAVPVLTPCARSRRES